MFYFHEGAEPTYNIKPANPNSVISRSACRFLRVTSVYPQEANATNFRLMRRNDTRPTPFNITAKEGIVYVDDVDLLNSNQSEISYDLTVEWHFKDGEVAKSKSLDVHVDVVDGDRCNVSADRAICAQFQTEGECSLAQGMIGTDVRGCSWRRNNNSTNLSQLYETCSVDLETCPNGHCDKLEAQNWNICPQDCAGHF